MIKQDNRPHSDTFEKRLDILTDLLHEDQTPEQEENTSDPAEALKREKFIFISVNGNNNVISTEKSQYTGWNNGKKATFAAAAFLCVLFF
ncbi:MAG: hypothetical protein IJ752_04460 [Alphaproteobacteria bacterium]|nr:hypothetical protein [Alphaproteobacteria bacterium]